MILWATDKGIDAAHTMLLGHVGRSRGKQWSSGIFVPDVAMVNRRKKGREGRVRGRAVKHGEKFILRSGRCGMSELAINCSGDKKKEMRWEKLLVL